MAVTKHGQHRSNHVWHAGRSRQLKCHVPWAWPAYQTLAYPAPAAFWSSAPPWQTRRRYDLEPVGDPPPWVPPPGSSHIGPCAAYVPKVEGSCKISHVISQNKETMKKGQYMGNLWLKKKQIRHSHPPCILVQRRKRPSDYSGWKCWALKGVRLLCGRIVFPLRKKAQRKVRTLKLW